VPLPFVISHWLQKPDLNAGISVLAFPRAVLDVCVQTNLCVSELHFGWRGQFIPSKRTPLPFTIIDTVKPYCESSLAISGLELAVDHSVNFARRLPRAKYFFHNHDLEK
jgi:hypothetical protein